VATDAVQAAADGLRFWQAAAAEGVLAVQGEARLMLGAKEEEDIMMIQISKRIGKKRD